MKEFKVVGWTNFEDVYPTRKYQNGEELNKALIAVRNAIVENRFMFAGEDHQYSQTGVPVLSDGTAFRCSMRVWGQIMASIYQKPNGERYSYMDFYMSIGKNCRMAEYKVIEVEPAKDIETSWGLTNQDDQNLVLEALNMGMPFMTTDKVLKEFYEKVKELKGL